MQDLFRRRHFAIAERRNFLDCSGVELILIEESANIAEKWEIGSDPASETVDIAEILSDLRIRKKVDVL